MRIITGDECGLLKEIIPELCRPLDSSNPSSAIHAGRARPSATSIQAAASSYGIDSQSSGVIGAVGRGTQRSVQRIETSDDVIGRERGIVSLALIPPDDTAGDDVATSFNFATLRINGIVESWQGNRDTSDEEVNVTAAMYKKRGELTNSVESDVSNGNSGGNTNEKNGSHTHEQSSSRGWYTQQPIRPIGMVSTYSNQHPSQATNSMLVTCDSIGTVSLINASKLSSGIVSAYNAFDIDHSSVLSPSSSKNNIGKGTLTYTKGRFANTNIATAMAIDGQGLKLAVGGRERTMRVLDLETGKLQWKAKNLPPDPQTLLQQPMWTTTIQFIHTPTNYLPSSDRAPTYLAATGTAYKQVQIYDIRASSPTHRPVLYTPENLLPHRITTLCQLRDGNTLAVGDAIGDCHLLDMRKMHSGKQYSSKFKHAKEDIGLGRLVGPGGSIRQLCMHPTLPYLACVGLDRKLWTWDVNRGKMIDCIYLRQRLNCCLFCDDESWDNANGNDNEDGMVKYNEGVNDDDMEDEVEDYVDSEDDGNDQANRSSESFEETDSESGEDQSQSENEDSDSDKGLEEVEDEEANPRKRRKKHPRR